MRTESGQEHETTRNRVEQASGWRVALGKSFGWFAALFALCIVVQVFLIGAAVFSYLSIDWHRSFVHAFEPIPLLMILVAWLGRRGRNALIVSAVLFVLIELQYVFIYIPNAAAGLHAVNALAIFYLAVNATHRYLPMRRRASAA